MNSEKRRPSGKIAGDVMKKGYSFQHIVIKPLYKSSKAINLAPVLTTSHLSQNTCRMILKEDCLATMPNILCPKHFFNKGQSKQSQDMKIFTEQYYVDNNVSQTE